MHPHHRERTPPRIWRAILSLALPTSDRRYVLADLEEEFEARVGREGVRGACAWYRSQVMRSVGPAIAGRVRRAWKYRETIRVVRPDRGGGWTMGIQDLLNDLRYAVRTLSRAPLTVLITVVSLGVGLGGVATVFTAADSVLHQPAPWLRDPERLVTIYTSEDDGTAFGGSSLADFDDLRSLDALEDASVSRLQLLSLDEDAHPTRLIAEVVSGNFFSVTGIQPLLGRAFSADEGRVGSGAAVGVISYALWTGRFGSDPGVVGRTIRLDGRPLTVIGVAPQGVFSRKVPVRPDVWVTLGAPQVKAPADGPEARADRGYQVMGRLRDGADISELRAQLATLGDGLARAYPTLWTDEHGKARVFSVLPERASRVNPRARQILRAVALFFFGATGLILLIACANVTGLFLVRVLRRGREVALRLALGASRGRIVRMLATEGVLLGLAAGLVGVGVSVLLSGAMRSFSLPVDVAVRLDFQPGARTYAFTFAVALITSMVFSVAPALRGSRFDLVPALKEGRGSGAKAGRRFRPGSILVGVQFAASLVLLVGAGLFLRSLQNATTMDLGFDPGGIAVTTRAVPEGMGPEASVQFYRELESRMEAVPGVSGAALSSGLEATLLQVSGPVSVRTGAPDEPEAGRSAFRNAVTPGYLQLLHLHLLRGRAIEEQDGPGAMPVAVVNEAFARTFWPDGDALGRSFTLISRRPGEEARHGTPRVVQIVGIAANGTYVDLGDAPTPYVWTSLYQDPAPTVAVIVKGASADAMVHTLRTRLDRAPGELPLIPPSTYESQLAFQFMPLQLLSKVLGWGGTFGLFLALIGVYGLVSFTVAQRTRDIAIRRAVGAGRVQVVGSMMRQGIGHAIAGLLVGFIVLIPAARVVRGLLVGVGPMDPVALAGGIGLLLGTAALASFVPARRAARVDPMISLREE